MHTLLLLCGWQRLKASYAKMGKTLFTIRNYRPSDFDSYARLHEETEAHDEAERYLSKQRLAEDLGHPSFHPQKDLFVAEQDGYLVGSISAFIEPGIGRALLDGLVHPLHRKKGIATQLFAHAIAHARQAGLNVAQICIPQTNPAAKNLMKRLKLALVRRFIGMEMDLATSALPDITTGNYTICHLQAGEVQMLTDIQNRSFAAAWGFNPNTVEDIDYRIHLSTCCPEDILMAWHGNNPIGYCWTRRLSGENISTEHRKGEIHMLGVDPDFRKRGVGRNVLLAGLSHLKNKGISRIELTTDGEDPAPYRLYESVGFKETLILQWYQKQLT